MASSIQRGDILIRRSTQAERFELHDALTDALLASSQTLRAALDLAMVRGGAVWSQNTDSDGLPLGDPVQLLPGT